MTLIKALKVGTPVAIYEYGTIFPERLMSTTQRLECFLSYQNEGHL